MNKVWIGALAWVVLLGTGTQAGEVAVGGVRFATEIERTFGEMPVRMTMTGAAVRTKLFVSVYSIASYTQEGIGVKNAEQLAGVDCPKCLHIVMLRDVSGKDVADAFYAAIRANYAEPALQTELTALHEMLKADNAVRGSHIWLTHTPGVGLHVDFAGKAFTIRNPVFSKAVWEIYLGRNNLGDAIKRGLTSRLQ